MTKSSNDYFEEYVKILEKKTDLEIIVSFNREVGICAWGTARSGYFSALRHEFNRRDIDTSNICKDGAISYRRKVSLYVINGRKVVVPII